MTELNQEQILKINKVEEYLTKYKINELFNELIAKVIIEKPEDLREFLYNEVKKIKTNPKSLFFTYKDFDGMFESYNILNLSSIPLNNLIQALSTIGIDATHSYLIERFPKLKNKAEINKSDFIDIMSTEYFQKITL